MCSNSSISTARMHIFLSYNNPQLMSVMTSFVSTFRIWQVGSPPMYRWILSMYPDPISLLSKIAGSVATDESLISDSFPDASAVLLLKIVF